MNFVIVPGAWSGQELWMGVIKGLKEKGYSVTFVKFPGAEKNTKVDVKNVTYASYAQTLAEIILRQEGKSVIITHSMSGMLTPLLESLAHKIHHVCQISAYIPSNGQSMLDQSRLYAPGSLDSAVNPPSGGWISLKQDKVGPLFFNACHESRQQTGASELFPQAIAPMRWVVSWPKSSHLKGKMTYFVCEKDKVISAVNQKVIAALHGMRLFILADADHFPSYSMPEQLVAGILECSGLKEKIVSKL